MFVFGFVCFYSSGGGKTVIQKYAEDSMQYLMQALQDEKIQELFPNIIIKDHFKSFVIEGATLPAVERDLMKNTGVTDASLFQQGKYIVAGSGIAYFTEAYTFLKDNSGPGKHNIGAFMCEVSFL